MISTRERICGAGFRTWYTLRLTSPSPVLRKIVCRASTSHLSNAAESYNGVLSVSPGEDFLVLGSHFALEGEARFLLDVLPTIVMLNNESQRESLRWAIERMLRDMRDPQPGGALIAQQVAYTLLVEALRLHLADDVQRSTGWLFALADSRMRAALSSIHGESASALDLTGVSAFRGDVADRLRPSL